jgi:hypothetical protein
LSDDEGRALNFFGRGTPGDGAALNIDVQFNVPVVKFSRRYGGTFLRHLVTGTFVLAHRGIVTLGHGRVGKAALFSEMAATLRQAGSGHGTAEFLLIGEMESPTLVNEIEAFSTELRRTVRALRDNPDHIEPDAAGTPTTPPQAPTAALRRYFDEFSGQRQLNAQQQTVADCYHGLVVRALRDAFINCGEVMKNREIDLIAMTDHNSFIFEVKTSADLQSIYTAIGQLSVHAPIVASYDSNKPLIKVVVLPEQPTKRLYEILTIALNIRVLTFSRSRQGTITLGELNDFIPQ